jgi:hypothetical protein
MDARTIVSAALDTIFAWEEAPQTYASIILDSVTGN